MQSTDYQDLKDLKSLLEHLSVIPDPRIDRHKKHPLIGVLGCLLCGSLAGCNSIVDIDMFCKEREEYLREILDLPHGIPSHDTIGRLLSLIDSKALESVLVTWTEGLRKKAPASVTLLPSMARRVEALLSWGIKGSIS